VSEKQPELNESEKMTVHSVTFTKSNKMIQVNETTSLLVASEAEGIDIDSSCRTGTCSECMIKCLSGRVSIDKQCEIDAQEREQGWIFSCCTYAQSDLVIDA
jgi:ferredoxin